MPDHATDGPAGPTGDDGDHGPVELVDTAVNPAELAHFLKLHEIAAQSRRGRASLVREIAHLDHTPATHQGEDHLPSLAFMHRSKLGKIDHERQTNSTFVHRKTSLQCNIARIMIDHERS